MALVIADRVKESTTTSGTGAVTLAGAASGYQSFLSAIGNGNTTYYCIADQTGVNWEIGIGTYTSASNTLARTTVLSSSNAGSLVNFGTNTKDVFVTLPAAAAPFAPGTKMAFFQAAAPTGWTQDVSDTANNRMLRLVNTAGGGTGGSSSPILNNVVPAHTHSFTTGTESADHTHSGATGYMNQNASHAHSVYDPWHSHGLDQSPYDGGGNLTPPGNNSYAYPNNSNTKYAGTSIGIYSTDTNHTHNFSTGGRSAAHTHSGTTDNGSSQTNWTPRYVDMILCTKN